MHGRCLPTRRRIYGRLPLLICQILGIDSGDKLPFHFKRRSLGLRSDSSRLKIAAMVSNIEYEVEVRDVEYQRQAGKGVRLRVGYESGFYGLLILKNYATSCSSRA
jgi:hypothetical protein